MSAEKQGVLNGSPHAATLLDRWKMLNKETIGVFEFGDHIELRNEAAKKLDSLCHEWEVSIDDFGQMRLGLSKYDPKILKTLVEWLIIKHGL